MLPLLEHRFFAEILREGLEPVMTGELRPDWTPALEWGVLRRLRDGEAALPATPRACLCLEWDGDAGAPYVAQVALRLDDERAGGEPIPLRYFTSTVHRAVAELVEQGKVNDGDEYRWRLCAYPASRSPSADVVDDGFEVSETGDCVPLPKLDGVQALLARAEHQGPRQPEEAGDDVPVLVDATVLREAQAAAVAAGSLEAGGILLGRLSRDTEAGDLVLQVSAQVPAREAMAGDASLRFTADTWKSVHAAIKLRHDDEQIVGWWHSHPAALWPCRNCPHERRAACPSNRAFFSSMDVGFHRTAFQSAHQVALLLSFMGDPMPRFDLFGWRRGVVGARGFYTLEA